MNGNYPRDVGLIEIAINMAMETSSGDEDDEFLILDYCRLHRKLKIIVREKKEKREFSYTHVRFSLKQEVSLGEIYQKTKI